MSSLPINSTASRSYDEQITKALNNYYSSPSKKTPIEKLRLRRNRLLNEMRAIAEKLFGLEQEYFLPVIASVNQVEKLNLSMDIFSEVLVNQQQNELWAILSKKDKYLSKLCKAYQKELMELDLEILSLESQPTAISAAA